MPGIRTIISIALLLCFIPGACPHSGFAQQPVDTFNSQPDQSAEASKRRETFELVWQTVDKSFYDPSFNGVDWKAVHDRYSPQAMRAASDAELYSVLQLMVNELHKSHFWIIPPEAIPKLRPKPKKAERKGDPAEEDEPQAEVTEAETALDIIKEDLADRLSTGIGIELRVVNGLVVVTRVEPGSAAARAGLRPGFVIKSVNGRVLTDAVLELEHSTLMRDIIRPIIPLVLVANYLNGNLADTVTVTYVDARNLPRRASISREKLKGEMSPAIGNLPSLYTEFEAKRLRGGIGYIRFNAFVPTLMKKVCSALREMHNAPGVIIDLRGNQGGLLGMVSGLSGLVQDYTSVFGTMKMRSSETPVLVTPQRMPYTRALAILIDGSTLSAAEIFAAGMQKTGRAVVVGETSAGNTLPSAILKLPTGALFQYAIGNYQTADGIFLEGRGVNPDHLVKLNRRALLRSGDPQLAVAVAKLRERIAPPRLKELVADVTVTPDSGKEPGTAPVKVEVPEPPPSAKTTTPPAPAGSTKSDDENARIAQDVINRYIEAVGGEKALLKITSRVSTGTVELPTGLTGTIEVYEAAPNRSSVFMNLKGFGVLQQTSDGKVSWLQDPVRGYLKMSAGGGDNFQRELGLRSLLSSLRFERKEKIGDQDCLVIDRLLSGRVIERFYFAADTGLLLRENGMYLEDYREVDGVKIPFVARQEGTRGMNTIVRLTNIRHNIPIDESKFAERADCFTRPEQNWIEK
ncbi:MAG TPA: S41 family peptidase [Pyrinomonadaceae bacterium]|nr:S41 family peptidase [Pyrinomonadaceae bacterium]